MTSPALDRKDATSKAEITPDHLPPADPYADTHISDRSELFAVGDGSADPTVHASTSSILDDPMPSSVNLNMPGPGAEALPTEVRSRTPLVVQPQAGSTPWAFMAAVFVAAVVVGASVFMMVR